MAKMEPKRFAPVSSDGPVRFVDVALHQDIRSDRDGLSQQYIRVAGTAVPDLEDFDTIILDLSVEIFDGDDRLGSLSQNELTIRSKDEKVPLDVPNAVQAAVSAKVTKVTIAIDATVVSKASGKVELALDEAAGQDD